MNRKYTCFSIYITKSQLICTCLFSFLISLFGFFLYGLIREQFPITVFLLFFFGCWLILIIISYCGNGCINAKKERQQRLEME